MKDKILTSSFLTLNAIILKYYACSKASLKPGKCIWGRRSYIMIHCHPLDVCGRFHRTHQRLPSTPSQCSANKIRPPAAKAADFLKAVTDFRVPWGPQVCNVRSFQEQSKKSVSKNGLFSLPVSVYFTGKNKVYDYLQNHWSFRLISFCCLNVANSQ